MLMSCCEMSAKLNFHLQKKHASRHKTCILLLKCFTRKPRTSAAFQRSELLQCSSCNSLNCFRPTSTFLYSECHPVEGECKYRDILQLQGQIGIMILHFNKHKMDFYPLTNNKMSLLIYHDFSFMFF